MKVLFVTPYYKPYLGGIERVVEKLAHEFIAQAHVEVAVLTSQWSFPRKFHDDWPAHETIDQEQIYRLPSVPHVAPPFFQVPLVWFSPLAVYKVLDQIKPNAIQLMSDRWFWVNYWVIRWAKKHRVPVVFSLSFHTLTPRQSFLKIINKKVVALADHIQAITEHERKLIATTYDLPAERVTVIPWGVDVHVPAAANIEHEPIRIVSVGRISHHKGQLWLAQRYIEAAFNPKSELVLIGEIEDAEIEAKIRSLALTPNKSIRITGNIDDRELNEWYQNADVFALFPNYEAFGLVFMEALGRQVPVLTHNVGAITEVIREGAIITDAYDVDQAQTQLERLVNDPILRQELGKKGYEFVRNTYSWSNTAKTFLSLYRTS